MQRASPRQRREPTRGLIEEEDSLHSEINRRAYDAGTMNVGESPSNDASAEVQQAVSRSRSPALAVVFAMVAGLLLRLWFILKHPYITGDSLLYGDLARNLLQHHVYGLSETLNGVPVAPHPTLIRLPGYPLFLALCFSIFGIAHYTGVFLLQALIDLWSCLLIAGSTRLIFGRRTALIALWLAVLCPFTANYVAAPLTETLTLFCIALVFFSLARWQAKLTHHALPGFNRWLAPLAFGLAYAILLRPEQGLLAAAVLPAMLWISTRSQSSKMRWRATLPVLLVASLTLLPLVPWAARNWRTFHVMQPLAPRFAMDPGESNPYGFQRWYRTWAIDFNSTDDVYWNYDGSAILIASVPERAFDSRQQYAETKALLDNYNEQQQASASLDERFGSLATVRIHASPIRYYVALPLARLLNMMLRPRTEMLPVEPEWWKIGDHVAMSVFAFCYAALNLAFFVCAAIALVHKQAWKSHRPLVWSMIATLGLRAALLLTLDNSEPRYTLEFFPILIVFAAATLARVHQPTL